MNNIQTLTSKVTQSLILLFCVAGYGHASDCDSVLWYDNIKGYAAKTAQYGEGIISIVIDPGHIKPLPDIFGDRCYHLNKDKTGTWNAQQTTLNDVPFENHAIGVAALIAGSCNEIEEDCWFSYIRGGCYKTRVVGIASKSFIVGFPVLKTYRTGGVMTGFEKFQGLRYFFDNAEGLDFDKLPDYQIDGNTRTLFKKPNYGVINISGGSYANKEEIDQWNDWASLHKDSVPLIVVAAGNSGKEMKDEDALKEFPHLLYKQDFVIVVAASKEEKIVREMLSY